MRSAIGPFDRVEILRAQYWLAADFHEGQFTPLYARLCRVQKHYRPGPLERSPRWNDWELGGRLYRHYARHSLYCRREEIDSDPKWIPYCRDF